MSFFFQIFVPGLGTYRSLYWSSTYRGISDLLPTAPSPAMQIFSLTTSPAAIIGPRPPPAPPLVAPPQRPLASGGSSPCTSRRPDTADRPGAHAIGPCSLTTRRRLGPASRSLRT